MNYYGVAGLKELDRYRWDYGNEVDGGGGSDEHGEGDGGGSYFVVKGEMNDSWERVKEELGVKMG